MKIFTCLHVPQCIHISVTLIQRRGAGSMFVDEMNLWPQIVGYRVGRIIIWKSGIRLLFIRGISPFSGNINCFFFFFFLITPMAKQHIILPSRHTAGNTDLDYYTCLTDDIHTWTGSVLYPRARIVAGETNSAYENPITFLSIRSGRSSIVQQQPK
jgi:hypothetical protein